MAIELNLMNGDSLDHENGSTLAERVVHHQYWCVEFGMNQLRDGMSDPKIKHGASGVEFWAHQNIEDVVWSFTEDVDTIDFNHLIAGMD